MSNPGPAITTGIPLQNLSSNQAIRLLAYARDIDVNKLGDTAMQVIDATTYSVTNVISCNASISLTTAAAGLWPAASGGGTAIVSNAALSANNATAVVDEQTVNTTNAQTAQVLYWNVATAQGAAATLDVYVYGYDLSRP